MRGPLLIGGSSNPFPGGYLGVLLGENPSKHTSIRFTPIQVESTITTTSRSHAAIIIFRMKFDYRHPVLEVSQWFTRINHISCRGGDQSLFVTKRLFNDIKGFNEDYIIYEDNEIISRLYNKKQFVVIPENLITSARRYRENGVWRLQYHFAVIYLKRRLGHSAESMLDYYTKRIK